MANSVGAGAITSLESYIGIGKEIAWGTGVTCTNQLFFDSESLSIKQNALVIEEIVRNTSRTYMDRVLTSRVVDGDVSFSFRPCDNACVLLLGQAFGGEITSATVSAASSFLHTIDIGDMVNNTNTAGAAFQGLSFNIRKGGTGGKVFEYTGVRVNELMFSAEIDNVLKCTASLIGKHGTTTTNDISAVMTGTSYSPLVFHQGRVSIEDTTTSLATASSFHVQSIEWGISNNLKADAESREIGSDELAVLPPGVANLTLNMSLRFDTTTAYAALIAGTKLSAEIEFIGVTISGSNQPQYLNFTFPRIYVKEGGDPEIGGPDEILKTDLVFDVLCDSVTGYSVQAKVRNATASY